MRLLVTERRSVKAIATERLPPLPIIVDHRSGDWSTMIEKRMLSALIDPDRECGTAFKVPRAISKELFAAMSQPFPTLDSLELDCLQTLDQNIPLPFLTVQPPRLRRLKLTSDASTFSCHILSCTRSLVDLTLHIDTIFSSPFETQLISHLQDMPLLRRLKLKMWGLLPSSDSTPDPPSGTKDVSLQKLNFLCFTGHMTQLEALMACLVAPSLQTLRIALDKTTPIHLAPHLSTFVRKKVKSFSCVQVNASKEGIKLFMLKRTHPSFKIIVNPPTSLEQMGHMFSAKLARVEVIFITSPFLPMTMPRLAPYIRWRTFFIAFHSAKTLRISPGIEKEVLQLGHGLFDAHVLPVLEEVELNATMHLDTPTQIDEDRRAAILGQFKPFLDARRGMGHTATVHWNTDQALPKYFYDSDTDM